MLPIQALPAQVRAGPAARPAQAGGGRFAVAGDGPPAEARASAAAAVPLEALVAAQEAEGDSRTARDRRARRHGSCLLEALGGLRHGLLGAGESVPAEALHRLAVLLANPQEAADPALGAIVEQIALRARIELARYGAA